MGKHRKPGKPREMFDTTGILPRPAKGRHRKEPPVHDLAAYLRIMGAARCEADDPRLCTTPDCMIHG